MGNHVAQRLSWWIPWQFRWRLLATASVISVLCVVIAFLGFMSKKPINSNEIGCDPIARCTDWRPLYWLEAGVISFACCMALTVVTFVVEKITRSDAGPRPDPFERSPGSGELAEGGAGRKGFLVCYGSERSPRVLCSTTPAGAAAFPCFRRVDSTRAARSSRAGSPSTIALSTSSSIRQSYSSSWPR